jgi:hypothetical protein
MGAGGRAVLLFEENLSLNFDILTFMWRLLKELSIDKLIAFQSFNLSMCLQFK